MGGRALARSAAFLIIPRSFVVGVRSGIKSRIQPILGQLESFLNNEGRIRVVDQVIFGVAVILDRVANQSAQKRDVRPARICRKRSAVAAVRVNRGSTTII